ncbi:MAG: RNA methyltransferase [Pseudomonadota bacterium]
MKLTKQGRGGVDALGPAPAVILCRPQLGENVGTAARAMLNFGLVELRLVEPRFGWPNAKAVAACSGAHEILNRMTIFDTVEAAIADLQHVYATTARIRDMRKPVLTAERAIGDIREQIDTGRKAGILFGRERTGLDNDELALADALVRVPINPEFASLNLAQAVLLIGYEWFKSVDETPERRVLSDPEAPATKGDLDGLLEHLVRELDAVAFFRSPDRRDSMIRTIKMVFERRAMSQPEIHLMRGIVKELRRGPDKTGGT